MKLKICHIVVPLVFVFAALSAQAQKGDTVEYTPSEVELMTKHYTDAYDSLINSYYLRKLNHHKMQSRRELSMDEFDALPDSVLMARLQAMHTVIPMSYNSEVRNHIRFYLRYMSRRLDVMMMLCEYYRPLFQDALHRYGVPEELKYLPIVESALNPMATSRAGAAGLWQFMYSTGQDYGLEVNSLVDERRDPYKSTVAAARFLSALHRTFGDWTLAIAAYNCGPGTIHKAIARSGGKRNFWEIYPYLPRETRGYIPAFIAATYVMTYYADHGIRPTKLEAPMRSDTVEVKDDMLMCYVRQFAGIGEEELRTLNPQYRTDFIPGASGRYHLCLPTSKLGAFLAHQDTIYAASRDSLSHRPINIEPDKSSIKGSKDKGRGKGKNVGGKKGGGTVYHTVKKGETLSAVARKYGLSVAQLKKLNGLKKDQIRVGQRLRVKN